MRYCVFICVLLASACSDPESAERDPFEGEVPTTTRPFNSVDVGVDVRTPDVGAGVACSLTHELSGAVSGTFQYPSIGSSCFAQRTDGSLIVTGINTTTNARFSVTLQLKDRGDDEVLEAGSGPLFEQPNAEGTTIWNGFGRDDCSYRIASNQAIGPTTYLLAGSGDCRRDVDPVPGSPIDKDLNFESFEFEFEYDWP